MYSARGHTIHDRLNMIELAKLEDAQKFEDMKSLLAHRNTRNKMLLEERMQAISLAKVICPKYDADNEYWKAVHNLTLQIKTVKNDIEELTSQVDTEMSRKKDSSDLVATLMNNVTTPVSKPPRNIETSRNRPISCASTVSSDIPRVEKNLSSNLDKEIDSNVDKVSINVNGNNGDACPSDNDNGDDNNDESTSSNNVRRK